MKNAADKRYFFNDSTGDVKVILTEQKIVFVSLLVV